MEWHTKDARYGFGHAGQLGWTGYTWNEKLIPQPQAFIEELRKDGIFVVLNDHPHDGVRDHERAYSQFMAMLGAGYPENPPFDAGDPKYMQAFFQAAHTPIEKQGVDFWWVDWQQNRLIPWVHRVPGLRHLPWLNCLYYRQSEQMTDGKTKLRGQGFSRWGGWGSHRYPIQFSGDTSCSRAGCSSERFPLPCGSIRILTSTGGPGYGANSSRMRCAALTCFVHACFLIFTQAFASAVRRRCRCSGRCIWNILRGTKHTNTRPSISSEITCWSPLSLPPVRARSTRQNGRSGSQKERGTTSSPVKSLMATRRAQSRRLWIRFPCTFAPARPLRCSRKR